MRRVSTTYAMMNGNHTYADLRYMKLSISIVSYSKFKDNRYRVVLKPTKDAAIKNLEQKIDALLKSKGPGAFDELIKLSEIYEN